MHSFRLDSSSHKKKYSSNLSPQHLVTSFDDAPSVGTLHDNLEHAIAQYGQVRREKKKQRRFAKR